MNRTELHRNQPIAHISGYVPRSFARPAIARRAGATSELPPTNAKSVAQFLRRHAEGHSVRLAGAGSPQYRKRRVS
jgi:hypothetical protein